MFASVYKGFKLFIIVFFSQASEGAAVHAGELPAPTLLESLQVLQEQDYLTHQGLDFIPDGGYCFSICFMNMFLGVQGMLPVEIENKDPDFKIQYATELTALDREYKSFAKAVTVENLKRFYMRIASFRGNRLSVVSHSFAKPSSLSSLSDFLNEGSLVGGGIFSAKSIAYKIYWRGKGKKKSLYYSSHMVGVATHQKEHEGNGSPVLWVFDSRKDQLQQVELFRSKKSWIMPLSSSSPLVQHILERGAPEFDGEEGYWYGRVFKVFTVCLEESAHSN